MMVDKRETGVMDLVNACFSGFITDQECIIMGDLLLNKIFTLCGDDDFDLVFPNNEAN